MCLPSNGISIGSTVVAVCRVTLHVDRHRDNATCDVCSRPHRMQAASMFNSVLLCDLHNHEAGVIMKIIIKLASVTVLFCFLSRVLELTAVVQCG